MKQSNFQNQAFADIFEAITRNMPNIVFMGILATYIITAALNVHFIPLPISYSIPAAIAIQFGRFAVVFMDFLNPTGSRSPWPPVVASVATVVSLVELGFSIQDMQLETGWSDARYWSVFLFGAMLISFGYILEMNFISKGAEGYGMQRNAQQAQRVTRMEVQPLRDDYKPTLATITAEATEPAKRPEIMRELREKQEAKSGTNYVATGLEKKGNEHIIKAAIGKKRATLRAYQHKQLNQQGNPATVQAGIDRVTREIEELKALL